MEERLTGRGGEIVAEVRAGVATVTLNRPAALNALSYGMLCTLRQWLDEWEKDDSIAMVVLRGAGGKAFCAGGDVRALHAGLVANDARLREFFEVEYALDHRIHTYPKTVVANIDGIVMGGGMGLSQGARVRGELGTYLGLTGITIGASNAVYCGLADVYVGEQDPMPAPSLASVRAAIDRHFEGHSVHAIVASLRREEDPRYRDWAKQTLEMLEQRSPTALAVTLEQLRRGRKLALADCFRMELNIIHGCFEHGDMQEGIRAVIVDKDNQPRWQPAGTVEPFFRPRWAPAQHPLASLR